MTDKLSKSLSIIGFIASMVALAVAWFTFKASRDAVRAQTWQMIIATQHDIDRQFIDHPELWPYFNNRKEIDPAMNKDDYYRLLALSDFHLDFFDSLAANDVLIQDLPGMGPGGKYKVTWDKYMTNSFQNSPILCARLADEPDLWLNELKQIAIRSGCNLSSPAKLSKPSEKRNQ